MTDGSVKVEAYLDDRKYKRGMKGLIRDMDVAERKLKEFNVEGERGGDILNGLGVGALGLGTALVTALTAGVAASPQFKQFLGELAPSFFELSDFLGEKLTPLFDELVPLVEDFVSAFTTSDVSDTVFAAVVKSGMDFITIINGIKSAWDSLPEGLQKLIETSGGVVGTALVNPAALVTNVPETVSSVNTGVGDWLGVPEENQAIVNRGVALGGELITDVVIGDLSELRRDVKEVGNMFVEALKEPFQLLGWL